MFGARRGNPTATGLRPGDLRPRDDAEHQSRVPDFPSPAAFLGLFLTCGRYDATHPGMTTNPGGFCDPRVDRLVRRAEAFHAGDPARAAISWRRADRLATDRAAWLATVNLSSTQLLSPRTEHLTHTGGGFVALDQLWVR